MDRRTTIKWMFAAAATVPSLQVSFAADAALARDVATGQKGYGTDPDLVKEWKAGGPWPLTLSESARLTAAALCDLIIPADDQSPAASAVGVVDFIDEWISAPYPQQRADREIVLPGLAWIEAESQQRFGKGFAAATDVATRRHCRQHLLGGAGQARVRRGGEVLCEVPRPHRGRVLHHARGNEGHRVSRQCAAGDVRRTTHRGAEEGRIGLSGGRPPSSADPAIHGDP